MQTDNSQIGSSPIYIDKFKLQSNPEEFFRDECEKYARLNLHKEIVSIDAYMITDQDETDGVFAHYYQFPGQIEHDGNPISSKGWFKTSKNQQSHNISKNKNLSSLSGFKIDQSKSLAENPKGFIDSQILDIKNSNEVHIVEDRDGQYRQHMVVKTWEKIKIDKIIDFEEQEKKIQLIFQIKTLRIYDLEFPLPRTILTEQVDGNFKNNVFYDTSTLVHEQNLYFFKRIQKWRAAGDNGSQYDSFDSFSNISSESHSYLELHKISLTNYNQRQSVKVERDEDAYDLYEYTDDDIPINFSVLFGQEFGQIEEQEYDSEKEFLDNQFILCQKYIEGQGVSNFGIFKMDCLWDPIYLDVIQIQSPNNSVDIPDQSENGTTQILYFHYTKNQGKIVFILVTQNQHIHIEYDPAEEEPEKKCVKIGEYQSSQITKIQMPQIQIHNKFIKKDSEENINQHYFIDFQNEIQLIYPQYQTKSKKFEIIDYLKQVTGIRNMDFRNFKSVSIQEVGHDHSVHPKEEICKNVMQEIAHLRKILAHKNINKEQQLTFVKDYFDQILYITQSDLNSIILIQMRDKHTEEIYEGEDAAQVLVKQFTRQLTSKRVKEKGKQKDKMAQVGSAGKKSSTRQIKIQNHFLTKSNVKDYLSSNQEFEDNIEIDIDTQQVMVTRVYEQQNLKSSPYIEIEDRSGKIRKILAYNSKRIQLPEVRAEAIQRSEDFYLFVLSLASYTLDGTRIITYIFVKKRVQTVLDLINDSMNFEKKQFNRQNALLQENQEVNLLIPGKSFEKIKVERLNEIAQIQKNQLRLTFETFIDIKKSLSFLCLIYQDNQNQKDNSLIIYDIDQEEIKKSIEINPSQNQIPWMFVDEMGFNSFLMTRSSDKEVYDGLESDSEQDQAVSMSYQVFTIYNTKLGLIQVQEFMIKYNWNQPLMYNQQGFNDLYSCQLVSQKQLFLSQQVIENTDWNYLKKSIVVPFQDSDGSFHGTSFIMYQSKQQKNKDKVVINLIDRKKNNLTSYVSSIFEIGQKKFQLKNLDEFIICIQTKMREDKLQFFDQQETYSMLQKAQKLCLEMRRPCLEFILTNNFKDLIDDDFFTCQEILHGKSICDLALSTSKYVTQALVSFQNDEEKYLKKTYLYELVKGDLIRQEALKSIGMFPTQSVINQDFDFETTINRALDHNALQSLQLLLAFIADEENHSSYYQVIMLTLSELIRKIPSEIFFYLDEDIDELKSVDRGQFCNIEIPLINENLPVFSTQEQEHILVQRLNSIHEVDEELVQVVVDSWKEQENSRFKYQLEHTYIDFNWLIIGEKLKSFKKNEMPLFDDKWLSELIMHNYDNHNYSALYGTSSMKKIIDYQFEKKTQFFMSFLLFFYFIFFVCPYGVSLVYKDDQTQMTVYKICMLPQILLFVIEMVKLKENKWAYFNFTNMIDLLQICSFWVIYFLKKSEIEDYKGDPPEITQIVQIALLWLSFAKFLHFIVVFETIGFLLDMLAFCLSKLVNFSIGYVAFGLIFAILYQIMGAKTDSEIAPGVYLGNFGRLFVLVWRNGVGKLGIITYNHQLLNSKSEYKWINIQIIWAIYYIQVLYQLVFGLNFIIAILEEQYKIIEARKNEYIYRSKARLNCECYQLMNYLTRGDSIRALIFQYADIVAIKNHQQDIEFAELTSRIQFLYGEYVNIYDKKQDQMIRSLEFIERQQTQQYQQFNLDCQNYEKGLIKFKKQVEKTLRKNIVKDQNLLTALVREETRKLMLKTDPSLTSNQIKSSRLSLLK